MTNSNDRPKPVPLAEPTIKLWADNVRLHFDVAVTTLKLSPEQCCSLVVENFKIKVGHKYYPDHTYWIPKILLGGEYPTPAVAGVWLVEFDGQTPLIDAITDLTTRRPSSEDKEDTAIKPDRNGSQGRGGPGIKEDLFRMFFSPKLIKGD